MTSVQFVPRFFNWKCFGVWVVECGWLIVDNFFDTSSEVGEDFGLEPGVFLEPDVIARAGVWERDGLGSI